jgi:hypothetical protein
MHRATVISKTWRRKLLRQIKTAKPAIGEVQMYLFAKSPLGPDAKAIPHQQHADQQFRIDRWATCVAVEIRKMCPNTAQIKKPINRS